MWIRNLSQVYSLLVCLVTCLILMVCTALMLINSVGVGFPELRNASKLSEYISNESFLLNVHNSYQDEKKQRFSELKGLSQDELTARRVQERSETLTKYKASSMEALLETSIWFLVAALFFVFHWTLYRRLEKRPVIRC